MRIAVAQMCSGISPIDNARVLQNYIGDAAAQKAEILFTPEMTGLVDRDRARAMAHIYPESEDPVLAAACAAAKHAQIWVALGSLAIQPIESGSEKSVNRSFLINPVGDIVARYDKIHLFDVDLDSGESWRESSAYQGGTQAVTARFGETVLGLSVCYDLRFPALYAGLTNAGAEILAIPAAFTVPTGKAHWEILLRARAIEAGVFVVAAAQCGAHEDGRKTYGHSLIVDPWGQVLLDMDTEIGVAVCDINLQEVAKTRRRIPAIANRRTFALPKDFG
ncbi:MAG: carbon-nitrogen hydrolase family protein [Parasphingorhabdus sp.]|uniref:carbon-nitrogen hydrolase family protein n=1 Tax=Parasphingorhabdus sp. TaxID=2709688 RepID=UPI0032981E04